MGHTLRHRLRELSGVEIAAYALVTFIALIAVAVLALDSDTPRSSTAQRQPTPAAQTPETLRKCADLEIPARPPRPVTCATKTATIVIASETTPVLLGGTQARLLAATLSDGALTARMRIRNETDAEQGVLAGGQEIHVNLNGRRLEAARGEEVRIAPGEAETVTIRFPADARAATTLRRTEGEAELGIRPWSAKPGEETGPVGVIRFKADLA